MMGRTLHIGIIQTLEFAPVLENRIFVGPLTRAPKGGGDASGGVGVNVGTASNNNHLPLARMATMERWCELTQLYVLCTDNLPISSYKIYNVYVCNKNELSGGTLFDGDWDLEGRDNI